MKWFLINGVLLAAGALWMIGRHAELARLQEKHAALEQALKSYNDLAAQDSRLSKIAIDTNELSQLRGEHLELMKLRSEVGQLRENSVGALQQRVAAAQAQQEQAEKRAGLVVATVEADERSRTVMQHCAMLLSELRGYAKNNGGHYPASFDQFIAWVSTDSPLARLARERPLKVDLSPAALARQFQPSEFDLLAPAVPPASNGRFIVLREKTPRQFPDGTWARAYGFSDGAIDEIHLPDGNFAGYEAKASGP